MVRIGGTVAGDLRVVSTNQLQVRAPSGSFGEADVTVESLLFPGESSVGPQPYFYAAKETGSVALDDSAPAPVSASTARVGATR